MTWNYRICREEYDKWDEKLHDPADRYSFSIRTVYYLDGHSNDDTKIMLTSVNPIDPYGATVDDLKSDVAKMNVALEKPVIDLDTIEYAPNK